MKSGISNNTNSKSRCCLLVTTAIHIVAERTRLAIHTSAGTVCPADSAQKRRIAYLRFRKPFAGGDLRYLMYGADKNSCVLPCAADGVVRFKVEAMPNYEIKPLTVDDLPEYAEVIRKSFATVADDFGWTQDAAPTFTAYITDEKLSAKYADGYYPIALYVDGVMAGFVSLTDVSGGAYG